MSRFMKIITTLLLTVSGINAGVYEELQYGDSKQEVTDKLMACNRVENTVPETMFARVGLNGTFKIKKDLHGINFSLFFDWNESGKLKVITLRSDAIEQKEFTSTLSEVFKSAHLLLTEAYGPPVMANPMPSSNKIEDGEALKSHLWHVNGGTLLMGVAKDQGKLHLSIRFLEQHIDPVAK